MASARPCPALTVTVLLLSLVVGGLAGYAGNDSKPFWTSSMLEWGMAVETPEQFRPLLAKLESGQAINVMAWGSSVVASHGGCYNEVSKQFMIKTRGYPPENCDQHEYGWLTLFLRDINATWPAYNPEHLLANLGRSGAFLEVLLKTCYENSVPEPVDLIILENLAGLGQPFSLEQTITALLRLAASRDPTAPRPTIIMINSAHVVDSGDPVRVDCVTRDWCNSNCTSKKSGFKHLLTKEHRTPDIQIEIAKTYGINLISVADFLNTGMEKRIFPHTGVKSCMFLASVMKDHVHPNHLGKRLFADLIWKALERAQRALLKGGAVAAVEGTKSKRRDQEQEEEVEVEEGDKAEGKRAKGHHGSDRQRSLAIPSHPIFAKGHKVFVKRCYMQGEMSRPDLAHGTEAHSVHRPFLNVVKSSGWVLVHYDGNRANMFRPGLVAHQPGSLLQVEIDTRLPGVAGKTILDITYLSSYEGWGKVEVSCVSGCECETEEIDSYHTYHNTIPAIRSVQVSVMPKCVIQLLSSEGQGGKAFKVMGLVVRATADLNGVISHDDYEDGEVEEEEEDGEDETDDEDEDEEDTNETDEEDKGKEKRKSSHKDKEDD